MLYLVGGASRSGKSQLVRKLLSKQKIPYFPLDAIMIACLMKADCFTFGHNDLPEERSATLWPFTANIINITSFHSENYAFEGDYILPENVASFQKSYPSRSVSAVFLGYAEINPQKKLQDIRHHVSQTDWTRKLSDDELIDHINLHIEFSKRLKQRCTDCGFSYLEYGDNFSLYLDKAYRHLTQNTS